MHLKEAEIIINKIEANFNLKYYDLTEFLELLSSFDFDVAIRAVEHLKKNGILRNGERMRKLPTLPEFFDIYKLFAPPILVFNTCDICNGNGAVVYNEYHDLMNSDLKAWNDVQKISIPYHTVLTCVCKGGKLILKYFDLEKLKAERKKGAIPMPDYVRVECKKHGINLKTMIGGNYECPF